MLNSSDPNCPGSSAGVAFVINKEIMNVSNAKMSVLIPGRAIALTIKWHEEKKIRILNIYTPNNHSEHQRFWNTVRSQWLLNGLGTLDFMMAPSRPDNENAREALRNFKTSLNLQDTWRHAHPTEQLFTFTSNANSLSRLDRIYTSNTHDKSVSDWKSYLCPIPTDHNIVLVRFAPPGLPHIGQGRWTWPLGILSDCNLIKKIEERGIKLQEEIELRNTPETRTPSDNPQTLWETFKTQISEIIPTLR
ncbi:hypothetical protein BDR03DRAFT_934118 [Suillus americanus]|nr:hypothetical protein BDR03DRAFT_934118 [Suillus americanus]